MRPKLKPSRIIARVSQPVYDYVTREARREQMTVSTWVCRVLTRMMEDKAAHDKIAREAGGRKGE